jgi:glyoxylase I family protein
LCKDTILRLYPWRILTEVVKESIAHFFLYSRKKGYFCPVYKADGAMDKTLIKDLPMIELTKLHHVAVICSDYEKSKAFYTNTLGFEIKDEVYREEKQSYKLDLSLKGEYLIELFSFPDPPQRVTKPEATGLRHIAFEVEDVDVCVKHLTDSGIYVEPVRTDEYTGRKFTFLFDPDHLPIELYER